jgi:hypothetical protein
VAEWVRVVLGHRPRQMRSVLSAARISLGDNGAFVFFHCASAARAGRQQLTLPQLHNVATLCALVSGVFLNHREWHVVPFVYEIVPEQKETAIRWSQMLFVGYP